MTFRKLHRKIAPILFLPLCLSALTGIAYRLGRNWFEIPNELANTLITIHQGAFLGQPLVPFYVLLVGAGLLGLLITGITMLFRSKLNVFGRKGRLTGRQLHRLVAPIACLPLLASAITGVAYRLGRNWFGLSNQQAMVLLNIHQGAYFGDTLRPFYILLMGLGLLVLLMTGIRMTGILRQRSKATH